MSIRALLGKAFAVAALSASLVGVTAGTASAKPWEGPECVNLHSGFTQAYDAAAIYLAAGNMHYYRLWDARGDKVYANYLRAGCG